MRRQGLKEATLKEAALKEAALKEATLKEATLKEATLKEAKMLPLSSGGRSLAIERAGLKQRRATAADGPAP